MSDTSAYLCVGVAGIALVGVVILGTRRPAVEQAAAAPEPEVPVGKACPNHPAAGRGGCACPWRLTSAGETAAMDEDLDPAVVRRLMAADPEPGVLDDYPQWRRNLDTARAARRGDPDSVRADGQPRS